jgi:hypothetical protein
VLPLTRAAAALAAVVSVLAAAAPAAARLESPRPQWEPVEWRRSASLGLPWAGRLAGGVALPSEGATFFTWDPVQRRSPNRAWRRVGSDRLVRLLLAVARDYAWAHPKAPRLGVGDLSRPRGGDFGIRFGRPGHVSHQNGRDADIYYPRRDGRERAPAKPSQIDRALAQDLVDRLVAAGASRLFVGPRTGLRGPRRVVQVLAHHDNHVHVRIPPTLQVAGRSALGRPIRLARAGGEDAPRRVLVVGCIHGDECAGTAVTRRLLRARLPDGVALWIVPNLNPDGAARGTRQNGRGVDLNRNFGSEWAPIGRRWSPEYSGPRPWSEPETRLARDLILRFRPQVTIWFHQPQALVRAWGPSVEAARRYARLARVPYRSLRWPNGTGPNWQNHRFPRASSFVVELPPGPLPAAAAARHAAAILRLAQ